MVWVDLIPYRFNRALPFTVIPFGTDFIRHSSGATATLCISPPEVLTIQIEGEILGHHVTIVEDHHKVDLEFHLEPTRVHRWASK